jgi:hypothetical protein
MLTILSLLLLKHWYVDFVQQTSEHIQHKGTYGHPKGIEHSLWHGLYTALIFFLVLSFEEAVLLGLADFVLHYHIDYVKIQYGEKDLKEKRFWSHFGLDQFAHQITYILLTAIAMGL